MIQEQILLSLIHFLNEGSKDKRAIESFLGRDRNIDHYLDKLHFFGILDARFSEINVKI